MTVEPNMSDHTDAFKIGLETHRDYDLTQNVKSSSMTHDASHVRKQRKQSETLSSVHLHSTDSNLPNVSYKLQAPMFL